jgi:3'(2'), 5'-bisphosphate nucleotidase
VIHIPVSNETYWGSKLNGSFHQKDNQKPQPINVSDCRKDSIRILTSRSHPDKILNTILKELDDYQIIKKGSSLKFCFIASGRADLYMRLGPTSEWDTGAGEAIVRFAGGYISSIDGKSITYNLKESILNPNFIVSNSKYLIDVFIKLIK